MLGFDVTVYNNQEADDVAPGVYNGVTYKSVWEEEKEEQHYDIVVSSRTVYPFTRPGEQIHGYMPTDRDKKYLGSDFYRNITKNAKLKALWLHDTFCQGDHVIEELVVQGYIDELFTLSDWHTSYILNCQHSDKMRNYEVLKNHVFLTRNGMLTFPIEVDIAKKDPNHFVYNASVTKGMHPLLHNVWPEVRKHIPNAKLTIIGGYYRVKEEEGPDTHESMWHALKKQYDGKNGITFTGIITQAEIAEILVDAKFFLYPSAFPETFGISTLEAQYYNCVPITCRFGALEEIALDETSWKMDYAIVPNSLFPHIDAKEQARKFVDLVLEAYNNPYLTQQKAYACNRIKSVASWKNVANQWKWHFYHKLGWYLPVEEYMYIARSCDKFRRIFGRRTLNPEETLSVKKMPEQKIYIISPFYNGAKYIGDCIRSVAAQEYEHYTHVIIDDNSNDDVESAIEEALAELSEAKKERIHWYTNEVNLGAVHNQMAFTKYRIAEEESDAIIVLLDGDDSLVNNPNIFTMLNNYYWDNQAEFTYGSCWSMADNIPLIAQPYPEEVKKNKKYREHKFNWGIPYTHLRTFKKKLLNDIPDEVFMDNDGNWFKAGGDVAVFYNLIEAADPDKVICIPDILVNYNDTNPLNDYKVNSAEQTRTAALARAKSVETIQQEKEQAVEEAERVKRILIAIPTARNIEVDTFKSIFDLDVPPGCELDFQYFYGYNVEQVRNLIAYYTIENGYDYLFSVDSDIILPKDTLTKMVAHDKDMVTGIYVQRIPGTHTIEVYGVPEGGGMTHIPYELLKDKGLVEVAGCGFGCVLVKRKVIAGLEYPHFVYKSAIDHKDTVSEDVYFCMKAREKGFQVWVDTSILCDHIGSTVFKV
jgi:glycosyltransferase involved in cell wall biosynthesis/GT2 family glycosyltransferase